jgi:hypothetical protein
MTKMQNFLKFGRICSVKLQTKPFETWQQWRIKFLVLWKKTIYTRTYKRTFALDAVLKHKMVQGGHILYITS